MLHPGAPALDPAGSLEVRVATASQTQPLTTHRALVGVANPKASWLVAGASVAPLLRHPCRARIVNVTLAVALIAATALAILP